MGEEGITFTGTAEEVRYVRSNLLQKTSRVSAWRKMMISREMIIEHFYKNKNHSTFLLKVFLSLDDTLVISIGGSKG